jgi:hypothetical protein
MKKELVDKLAEKYPTLFKDLWGDKTKTCMAWGIECGDGWYQILDDCFKEILECPSGDTIVLVQVKEKYGTLRIYTNSGTDCIDEAIDRAEIKSETTCEDCGDFGVLDTTGWWSVRCENH